MNFTLSDMQLTGRGTDTLANLEHARLTGGVGNNTLRASSFSGPVTLDGGAGNDRLFGGGPLAVLVGGAGNDTLTAGAGRDILFGGLGKDKLVGGAGSNLLIGGTQDFDVVSPVFASVTAEWARTDILYPAIVAHLQTGGGLNGTNVLDVTTVHDDGVADSLTGGAALDWFFATVPEVVDQDVGEIVS